MVATLEIACSAPTNMKNESVEELLGHYEQ